ncbi:hypothetical protein I7I50_04250 [Histoplasma capsulatum G186AR]|uniref:Uncharacterized protein n=1 Tax=Ajellomyces capsulatus TaxID=5037 RepID=A0A8H7YJX3_AJECA|nr:hypothetical protein I7I52_05158 [Histoplasma capsulatum]QSS75192.1 hypothetical protein I7I50_04250 [Histoplasma capsulatum G186AR]
MGRESSCSGTFTRIFRICSYKLQLALMEMGATIYNEPPCINPCECNIRKSLNDPRFQSPHNWKGGNIAIRSVTKVVSRGDGRIARMSPIRALNNEFVEENGD